METRDPNLKKDEYRKPLTIFEVIKANLTLPSEAPSLDDKSFVKPEARIQEDEKPREFLFPISLLF